jgi:hypothetical protein
MVLGKAHNVQSLPSFPSRRANESHLRTSRTIGTWVWDMGLSKMGFACSSYGKGGMLLIMVTRQVESYSCPFRTFLLTLQYVGHLTGFAPLEYTALKSHILLSFIHSRTCAKPQQLYLVFLFESYPGQLINCPLACIFFITVSTFALCMQSLISLMLDEARQKVMR